MNKLVRSNYIVNQIKSEVRKISSKLSILNQSIDDQFSTTNRLVDFVTVDEKEATISPSQVSSVYEHDKESSIISLHNGSEFHVCGSTSSVVKRLKMVK